MSYRPSRRNPSTTELNRCAKLSQRDVVDSTPDTLCLLKRKVQVMDALEVSDRPAWVIAVAALPTRSRKMFQGGNCDRLHMRYQVYGSDAGTLTLILADFP